MDLMTMLSKENEDFEGISFRLLRNNGDDRGSSFNLPADAYEFIGSIVDVHAAIIKPNSIRGNHYHIGRKEIIIVLFNDSFTLGWDRGERTISEQKTFSGKGAVAIYIKGGISHAIKNTGTKDISIFACNNSVYDKGIPDTIKRNVLT